MKYNFIPLVYLIDRYILQVKAEYEIKTDKFSKLKRKYGLYL